MTQKTLQGWFIVAVTDDGPSRVEGTKTYTNRVEAERAVRRIFAAGASGAFHRGTLCICHAEGNYWVDPNVHILDDFMKDGTP